MADELNGPDPTKPPGEEAREPSHPLQGLHDARLVSLDRVHIRTRESLVTRSAWRLVAGCAEGDGTISLIEISPTVSLYRGEGVFLGWSSDHLQDAYRTLLPQEKSPDFELPQLG